MSKIQSRMTVAAFALLLLLITMLRLDLFIGTEMGVWLYRILASLSILGLVWAIGSLFSTKVMRWLLVALVLGECLMAVGFRLTAMRVSMPTPIVSAFSYLYFFHFCEAMIYHENRSRYDEQVFYTLKPGQFSFKNIEFSNHYEVNSLGFRDDEASLQNPGMVFLGDSYTMGWGVDQDASYPELLAKRFGKKALNTGIASYGTARELLALRKVQLDSCRLLVLQFCPNDVAENRSFMADGLNLKVSPRRVYENEMRHNRLNAHYFPFKFTYGCCAFVVKKIREGITHTGKPNGYPNSLSQTEVADFFGIVQEMRKLYAGPIVILHLGMGVTKPEVYNEFQQWLLANPMPGVSLFNTAEVLSEPDYYLLDKHLIVAGNEKLAVGLASFMEGEGIGW